MEARDELIKCACSDPDHALIVNYQSDEVGWDVGVFIQMNRFPFFKRLRLAISYVMGRVSPYGHWEETLLGPDQVVQLRDALNQAISEDPKRENGIIRPEYRDPDNADPYRGQGEA